uniref:Aminotransferase-like plant mobile domain-containing protein n=1 Tax=Ananas comosus var. bracteatus TaxID=296719 RepID=A0A6V7NHG9_ANACO|nr:unnamed protein product [Ananas comosus var. bracteatus]
MASQMAHGTRFVLAPAVLCAIQATLGRMVSDRRGPAYPYCRFPIDFLFTWVGARFEKVYTHRPIREDVKSMPGLKKVPDMLSFMYAISTPFDSKRTRQHLRDERNFIWRPYSFNCSGEGWVHEVIDMRERSDFPEEVQEWVISLRHSVLPLRLGGGLYAQPYNPHRFARQCGLDQHFPESSDVSRETALTGVLAGYWLDLTQVSHSLKFFIPDDSRRGKPSSHYARWWTNSLYSYFQHGNFLVERESCPKKNNEDLSEGPVPSPLSFELRDSSKRIEVFPAPYDYVERHLIREDSERRPSPAPAAIETARVTPEPVGVDNCPRVSHTDEELSLLDPKKLPSPTPEELPSPTPKGIVEELPLPTLERFTLPIPRDTVEELPSPAPIEVEQILPSHYDDEEGDVDQEKNVEKAIVQEEVDAIEENTSLVEETSERIALNLDPTITTYVGSTLISQSLEQYSSEFARQEAEMAQLEKILADKRAANAELSNRMNMAKNCLQELDSTKEKIEGKSAEAERELIEAKEGHVCNNGASNSSGSYHQL